MALKRKLVLVEWLDSHSGRGWQDFEKLRQAAVPLYCRSVGWIVTEGNGVVVLVPHVSGEKNDDVVLQGSGDITIPKRAIVKTTVLRRG